MVTRSAEMPATQSWRSNRWLLLVTTSIGLFVVIIDNTVVNISVPSMIASFGTDLSRIEWVLNAYILAFASLLITFGRLGDMYGRRRMFLLGLAIFGVGSAACGLAASAEMLIVFRVFQAAGAAFMLPATLSLTDVNFPPEERGTAFGIWGAVSGFALGIGPTLGGLLTQFNWRYIFFINVPIVAVAIPLTLLVVPESKDEGEHRVDWPGVVLSILMLVAFNYAMIEGPSRGWDALVIGLLVAAAVLLGGFLWWERRAREPLMDLRLFRSRTFSAGNLVGVLLLFTMIGVFFLIPLYLQTVLRFSPLRTGLIIAPMSLTLMVVGPIAGHFSDVVGSRWLMFAGMLTISLGIFWISMLTGTVSFAELAPKFIVAGAGMGLVISPMTSAVMGSVPLGDAGGASGILATMRQVGAVLGIAILGAVLQASVATNLSSQLSTRLGFSKAAAQQLVRADERSRTGLVGGGSGALGQTVVDVAPQHRRSFLQNIGAAYSEAFTQSIATTFKVAAFVAFIGALLCLLVQRGSDQSRGRARPDVG